jgi:hypothetical protein
MAPEAAPFSTLVFVRSRCAPTIVGSDIPPRRTCPRVHLVRGVDRHPVAGLPLSRCSEPFPPRLMGWVLPMLPAPDATCGKERH